MDRKSQSSATAVIELAVIELIELIELAQFHSPMLNLA